ncbi:MAG: 4-hydroxy-tetrahydrodipicolinate reductase [Pirellulaceae bacterium]
MTTTSKLRIGIHGAAGRMGLRLVALGMMDPDLQVAAAMEFASHPDLGKDAGVLAGVGPIGVPLSSTVISDLQVVIDFSVPEATGHLLEACLAKKIPLVIATTGLSTQLKHRIGEAAETIPVVWSPSMSTAVNLAMRLAAVAAQTLQHYPGGADVEIIERHHRFKEDAPSGTALRFGEIITNIMGQTTPRHGRQGMTGKRPRHEIGYHALRVGDNPGEHTIVFGMLGETLEVTVRATNRDCYATGALQAAKFAARQQPGLYSMYDVLGIH